MDVNRSCSTPVVRCSIKQKNISTSMFTTGNDECLAVEKHVRQERNIKLVLLNSFIPGSSNVC